MSVFKDINEKKVSRRSFLKGMSVVAGTAVAGTAVTGCGNFTKEGESIDDKLPTAPEIKGEILYGSTPHNCGGGCLSKYYVENGVVKKIVTDENRPDGDVFLGKAQLRSCLRCRSRKEWWYRKDRLTVPLKRPDGVERGDVKNYVRISWDEAIKEIVAKQTAALEASNHDPRTVVVTYGLGDRTFQSTYMKRGVTGNCKYGTIPFSQDLSFPQWMYTNWFVDYEVPLPSFSGLRFQYRTANGRKDIANSDNLILWSINPAETRFGINTCQYIDKARELNPNFKVTVIDPRYTLTAETYADDFIAPVAGTDAALVLAMTYHILESAWGDTADATWVNNESTNLLMKAWKTVNGVTSTNPLTETEVVEYIDKYMHGFFDKETVTSDDVYTKDLRDIIDLTDPALGGDKAYCVPKGASFSAYIFGATKLLKNAGASIYPETIGYNVNADDILYDRTVPCYGQVAKTPEWAEKITGIKASKIKELAEMLCTTKVTTWHGAGVQRQTEGEQFCWALPILHTLTNQFGEKGKSYGFPMELDANVAGTAFTSNPINKSYIRDGKAESKPLFHAESFNQLFDYSKFTLADTLTDPTSDGILGNGMPTPGQRLVPMLGPSMTMTSLPVFLWADMVLNSGSGKSRWNSGKIKNATAGQGKTKIIYSIGGNSVTQAANTHYATEALSQADITFIACDIFMTPTVQLADYILPAKAAGEKWGITDSWLSSESVIMQPVSEPPSDEVLDEFEIGRRFAVAFGNEQGYKTIISADKAEVVVNNEEEYAEYIWDEFHKSHAQYQNAAVLKFTFEDFKKKGFFSAREAYGNNPQLAGFTVDVIARKFFKEDPKGSTVAAFTGMGAMPNMTVPPLMTATGKVEAYCQAMVEEYEASTDNIDASGNLPNAGAIYTKGTNSTNTDNVKRRFVYPVPMFIPSIEGRYADGTHPDPLAIGDTYKFIAQSFHEKSRVHSTLNNVAYLNELYKKDKDGKSTFISPDRDITDGAWDKGIYEPVYLNHKHAEEYGFVTGDLIQVESKYGKLQGSVILTNRVAPYTVGIASGSWNMFVNNIDVGGCVNTLYAGRPSRIGFGMTLGNDVRVKINRVRKV